MASPSLAIDVRLQSARWLQDLEERGKVVIEKVSDARLDEIAQDYDLTVVATGKFGAELFPRDNERSKYTEPQRNIALICLAGVPLRPPWADHINPIKVNLLPEHGEAFWVPWYQKDGQQCRSLIFEAAGGALDLATSAQVSGRADR